MNRNPKVRGFSLIEVIVALVVISSFGAALFVWAGQTLQLASRAAAVQQDAEIERNITELAYSLNPAEQPSGDLRTSTHRFHWQATPTHGPVDQVKHPSGISPYQVGLYQVRFTVTDLADPGVPRTSERIVAGWHQVRPRNSGPPGFGAAGARP
ncbi:MAG: type II secretion system protein [Burkholderiales bacterium]|nr:type II secretion system protein [Burkholderiales bacterium]